MTFKSKNVLLDCAVNQHPKSPKSMIDINKRSTENHFWKSKWTCLPNYRHLPHKNIDELGVSSENEPSRIERVKALIVLSIKTEFPVEFVNTCNIELWI